MTHHDDDRSSEPPAAVPTYFKYLLVASALFIAGVSAFFSVQGNPPRHLELPAMVFADFIKSWWIVILLSLVGAFLFFKAWKDNDANKPKWDEMKLKMPLIGAVISSRFYVQFLETMANLVSNGLPLLRALELSRDATQNISLRTRLNGVIAQVGDGRAFSKAMIRSESFPCN